MLGVQGIPALARPRSMLQFCLFSCARCYTSFSRTAAQVKHQTNISYSKYCTSGVAQWKTYPLKSRGLIQLTGADVVPFLQGLVTSDVTLLGDDSRGQYSMLLNVQGRVLYDLMLYDLSQVKGDNCVLVECQASVMSKIMSDIKKFKIRKKVQIEDVSDRLQVLAGVPVQTEKQELPFGGSIVMETRDPRVPSFGVRAIREVDQALPAHCVEDATEAGYHMRRYEWGIPEGSEDLPTGNCFPLESNLVLMNGVSFSKGCYLGQELTARTHHTGATRKRIMPLVFQGEEAEIEAGVNVTNEKGKNVGKYRARQGQYGLGLLRINDAVGELSIATKTGGTVKASASVPAWWPDDIMK